MSGVRLQSEYGPESAAIIGVACRLPGGTDSPAALSEALFAGRDLVTGVPGDRFDPALWAGTDPSRPGLSYTAAGGFLDDIGGFDAAFFGISPREAAQLDPQQRLLLELTVEAFDHAAVDPTQLAGAAGAVYAGVSTRGYWELLSARPEAVDAHSMLGTISAHTANRISFLLDWRGPSQAIDTACSSSLVAVHEAAGAISRGEVPIALAAGVGMLLNPADYLGFSKAGLLSPTGRCRAFSDRADGFVRAEGGGVILLKRLGDALADGDRVLAVIAGSGVNTDGRSSPGGLTQPSVTAQRELLQRVYASAGIGPDELVYLECHGTGTPVGDPVECRAIGEALGTRRREGRKLPIGSVKTNVGHLECASGMAGLLKALLVLQERRIPPSLHTRPLNPAIDFDGLGLSPVDTTTPIEHDSPLLAAGVNSFGIGGANAHVVLARRLDGQWGQARSRQGPVPQEGRKQVVLVSGRTPEALAEACWAMADRLLSEDGHGAPHGFHDVAYSSVRRRRHEHGCAVVARSADEAADKLYRIASGDAAPGAAAGRVPTPGTDVAFVFSGNGSQWQGMARELMGPGGDDAFAAKVREVCRALSPALGWEVSGALASGEYDLARTEVAQPLLFAVQLGICAALAARGIRPGMVVGHSVGEIAAACVAGRLDLETACRVVAVRSAAQGRTAGAGAMAAAAVDESTARRLLAETDGRVELAGVNSGTDVTFAGDTEALLRIGEKLTAEEVFFRSLPLDYAFHSAAMDSVQDEIMIGLAKIEDRESGIPFWSTVTGDRLDVPMDAGYWWRNIRHPVLFAPAVESMCEAGAGILVEIGPHPVLKGYLQKTSGVAPLATLARGRDADLDGVAAAVIAGGGPVADSWFPVPGQIVDLPAYPWQRERHWTGEPSWWSRGPGDGVLCHPLLGERIPGPAPQWSGVVEPARVPWLLDHRVGGAVTMPGAAYLELALAALARTGQDGPLRVDGMAVTAALTFDATEERLTALVTELRDGLVTISSRPRTDEARAAERRPWQEHARARVRALSGDRPQPLDLPEISARLAPGEELTGAQFYAMTTRAGTDYGPAFRSLTAARLHGGELLGRYELPAAVAAEAGRRSCGYVGHPALLDAMVHAGSPLLARVRSGDMLFVPVRFGAVTVWAPPPNTGVIHVRTRSAGRREAVWDVTLASPDGEIFCTMDGLRVQLIEGTPRPRTGLWRISEQPLTAAPVPADRRWAVAADTAGAVLADPIADALHAGPPVPARAGWHLTDPDATAVALVLGDDPAGAPLDEATRAGQLVRDLVLSVRGRTLDIWLITTGPTVGAAAWGTARTVANEEPHTVRRIAATDGPETADVLVRLLTAPPGGEDEFLVANGQVTVARLTAVPAPAPRSRPIPHPRAAEQATVLRVAETAMTPTLAWERIARPVPGPGQVLIDVRAAGLNYKDVMLATGLMRAEHGQLDRRGGDTDGAPLFGQECAGVVTAVGAGVREFAPGVRVMAIAPGSMATHTVAQAAATVSIPDGMTFTEAAALPLAYATAHYGLDVLAGLAPGETLLLPAAAGGVGQAAMALARRAGARVIALAGTEKKRDLVRSLGAWHAFDSRSAAFADQVRDVTGGRGVDVVLNSLTGEAAATALELLAPDGRFVELGKRDLYADRHLRLGPFLNTLSYFSVDLAQLIERRPDTARDVLARVAALAADGSLPPLPHRVFPPGELEAAFTLLKRSAHTGKLVVELTAIPRPTPAEPGFDPEGGYLVTGGSAGFGAATARWLHELGAGHIVVTGRTGTAKDPLPADTTVLAADATDAAATAAAVHRASQAPHGLKGVFHCAAHYDDAPLRDLTPERFAAVLAPKVQGAALLDRLTRHLDLDHFVLYSSIAALIGNRLQSAYGAANLCLEAVAARRRRLGLPALAVGWGPVADVGVVARDGLTEPLTGLGLEPITPREALHALGHALSVGHDTAHLVIARADWARLAAMFPGCASARFAQPGAEPGPAQDAPLAQKIAAATPEQAHTLATGTITSMITTITKTPLDRLDPGIPLDRLGIDSLLATELSVRLHQALNVHLPVLEIISSRGIADLSNRLLAALPKDHAR
ncbi:type I polyketide synthase [Streptomyces sp. NPDC058257]|uniref:type I polyketide synthase n=1 Tax=Streptomyces sp. NPDC058257 TaxID=3346409 RepID=UPI0036DFD437